MKKTLSIGKGFTLPRDVVTQKLAFLGRTGTGKTYAAMKLAEEMYRAGAQIVCLDVVGVWWGLRLAEDGTSPGLNIPVFGGLRGDIPLVATAGTVIADLIVDRSMSVVLDLSQFETDAAKAKFASAFADRFFRRMKSSPAPVHLFLEECQEIVPQNPARDENMMLHYWARLLKLGRNFGIGASLISQRPQEVNKKALNMSECLFAFQMTGQHERKAVKEWLGSKGAEGDQILQQLRTLEIGEAHVSSPQWLQFEGLVKISKRRTYDSSSTPSFEEMDRAKAGDLAPIDLKQLQAAMETTIAEAEASDPKLLKKRIRELEKQLRDVPVADPEEIAAEIREAVDLVRKAQVVKVTNMAENIAIRGRALMEEVQILQAELVEVKEVPKKAPPSPQVVVLPPQSNGVNEGVTRPQQRILDALASFEALGIHQVAKSTAAVFAGVSPKSSGYTNNLGTLRNGLGLIAYPVPREICLTDEGRLVANDVGEPLTLAQLHQAWCSKLSGPQGRIIKTLIELYPDSIGKPELAEAIHQSMKSSGYTNNLGWMRSLGIIDYPVPGYVVATELLFPAGLG